MTKKIQDLESLDLEIARLRNHAKMLEGKLDDGISYLQEHSSSLMMNSLLSSLFNKDSLAGSIVRLLIQSERLQQSLGDLAEIIIDKLAVVIEFLVAKISPKKD